MSIDSLTKETIEKQFNDLFNKAQQLYPNINEDICHYSNMIANTEHLQDYLNLTMQTPVEIANNHIAFT